MFISPVKAATYYAEMPPYEDKWTPPDMGLPSDEPGASDADGNLATGKMTVYADWTGIWEPGAKFGHVKMWKRVWLPAGTIYLDCSWKLKGLYFSKFFTSIRIHLSIFIEESLNTAIWEEDLYSFYKDDAYYFEDNVDENHPPQSYPATISEAGYYNVGESLFGATAGLDGLIDFDSEEGGDEGGWVSIKLRKPELSISAATGGTTSPASGTYSYDYGSSVTVTATAYSGYTFDGWRLNGVYAGNDNPITVTMDSDYTLAASFDQVPNTPSQPSGPTTGYRGVTYTYSTSTTDPDGAGVQYDFDWGDDSPYPTRTGWYPSGTTVSASHTWSSLGTYDVKVKARDGFGGESNWSPSLTVYIVNRAPNTPSRPYGPNSGLVGTYYYSTSTTDPDGDKVKYKFYWGDGHSYYTGYYSSGATVTAGHTWSTTGTYYVRVKACDVYGKWSGWSSSRTVIIYSGNGGCPILSVYDGSDYVDEGLLDIHNPEGVDVVYDHTLVSTPQRVEGAYLMRLTEHPKTHSYIDQVKLYAVLQDGTMKELPLIWAWHSEDGNVLPMLLHSDEWKANTLGADHNDGTSQSVDLKFAALSPNLEITGFVFQVEGNNAWFK